MADLIQPKITITIVPDGAGKDAASRLRQFETWLAGTGRSWLRPDLAAYRDHLLDRLSPASAAAHLSTIRGRYRRIIADNHTRDTLYDLAVARLTQTGQADTPANRKAFVDETLTRLGNEIAPVNAPVAVVVSQDRPDNGFVRLSREQASALLAAPGTKTLKGLRDTAILAVMLCTGVREQELVNLDVADLRQRLGGELALHVREGKGCKERLIPYGGMSWALAVVDKWLQRVGIVEGAVFRGFYRGGRAARPGRLTARSVQRVVGRYPVMVEGKPTRVKPHDLRRTYARRLYDMRVDLVAIQQNLGHSDLKTTLHYIGALDVEKRRPPSAYDFDLAAL